MKRVFGATFCCLLLSPVCAQVVPAETDALTGMVVADEESLISIIPQMYPHVGFSGTESLVYQFAATMGDTTDYHFLEYINGIPTEHIVSVRVANVKVLAVRGNVILDDGFRTDHDFTEGQAIEAVFEHVVQNGGARPLVIRRTPDDVRLIYRTVKNSNGSDPWWYVVLSGVGDYFVSPTGEVESALTLTY